MLEGKISIIHWCEGTGHATRSIPIAEKLKSKGCEVDVLGGGKGRKFLEMNGLEVPEEEELAEVELVPLLRDKEKSNLGKVTGIFTEVLPSTIRRFRNIWSWLKKENPEKVVTDDPLALIAASIQGKELYRLDHLRPELFDSLGRFIYSLYLEISLIVSEKIFFTALVERENSKEIVYVDPLAQEGEGEVESFNVLLIPGSFGEDFGNIKEGLQEKNLDVKMVGGEEWKPEPSMTPYVRAADCVVCTGYSAISDSVVPGTPCIVYPFLSFQKAIAAEISREDLPGLKSVDSVEEAVYEAENFSEGLGEKPVYNNGADEIVSRLLEEE